MVAHVNRVSYKGTKVPRLAWGALVGRWARLSQAIHVEPLNWEPPALPGRPLEAAPHYMRFFILKVTEVGI